MVAFAHTVTRTPAVVTFTSSGSFTWTGTGPISFSLDDMARGVLNILVRDNLKEVLAKQLKNWRWFQAFGIPSRITSPLPWDADHEPAMKAALPVVRVANARSGIAVLIDRARNKRKRFLQRLRAV